MLYNKKTKNQKYSSRFFRFLVRLKKYACTAAGRIICSQFSRAFNRSPGFLPIINNPISTTESISQSITSPHKKQIQKKKSMECIGIEPTTSIKKSSAHHELTL